MTTPCRSIPIALLLAASLCAQPAPQKAAARRAGGVLFQVSTLDALSSGMYEGTLTIAEVKKHGDFGVGTYEGLDGEMILLDGHAWHMRANGVLSEAADDETTPFAVVTRFDPQLRFSLRQVSMAQLAAAIDAALPSKNLFYALKVHGTFAALTARAIAKQFLPYAPLAQLVPLQSVFNYANAAGTAVGIRSPAFVSGINQPGYHFHYVSDDHKGGGHALDFTAAEVTVEIQVLRRHSVWLPDDEPFLNATLPLPQ